nr:hypothetical protein [Xanthomonas sp. DAR33341]
MDVSTTSLLAVKRATACIPAVPRVLLVMRHPRRLVMMAGVMVTAAAMVVEMVAVTVVETVEAMAVVTAAVMVVETVAVMAVVTATATVMATVILLVMVMARRLVRVKAARALPCPSSTKKAARLLSLC